MSTVTGLPDLLRRFTVTPYQFTAFLYSTTITFETNDPELLTAFRTRAEQLANALRYSDKSWYWKVARDHDISQDGNDSFVLSAQPLSTIFLGNETVAAIDWDQGELLGFVAANVPAQYLLDLLLDAAQQHHLHCERGSFRERRRNSNPL
jgi:hypothetical protein